MFQKLEKSTVSKVEKKLPKYLSETFLGGFQLNPMSNDLTKIEPVSKGLCLDIDGAMQYNVLFPYIIGLSTHRERGREHFVVSVINLVS